MISQEVWLFTCAALTLIYTVTFMANFRLIPNLIIGSGILLFSLSVSDVFTKISLVQLNNQLPWVSQTLGIFFLFECLLVTQFHKRYGLPVVSLIATFCYGLMMFYRWSYLALPFTTQSVIYAFGFVFVLTVLCLIARTLTPSRITLSVLAVFITLLYFGDLPAQGSSILQISLKHTLTSISVFLILSGSGIYLYFKNNKNL